jgi:glycine reductase
VIAGPAFGSGRYGLACALVCLAARELGIPAVTAMHPENPGAASFRRQVVIVPTGETATSLQASLEPIVRLALKLAGGQALGPSELEGYLSQGRRVSYDRRRPGYQRALDMLLDKLHGRPFVSEVPFRPPEKVAPAPPVADLGRARIAMITTGGLVRKGNPEGQVAANATRFHRHSVAELESLTPEGWEAYHAGYFNHIVNRNPNYILPLSFLRELEGKRLIGRVHEWIYALPGVSTPVATATRLGREIARDLKEAEVSGALLVAT